MHDSLIPSKTLSCSWLPLRPLPFQLASLGISRQHLHSRRCATLESKQRAMPAAVTGLLPLAKLGEAWDSVSSANGQALRPVV